MKKYLIKSFFQIKLYTIWIRINPIPVRLSKKFFFLLKVGGKWGGKGRHHVPLVMKYEFIFKNSQLIQTKQWTKNLIAIFSTLFFFYELDFEQIKTPPLYFRFTLLSLLFSPFNSWTIMLHILQSDWVKIWSFS